MRLRIIHPNGDGTFTAAGTSAPQTVADSEDRTRGPFPVNLPIKAGDRIALYVIAGAGAPINVGALLEGQLNYLADPFVDGTTRSPGPPPAPGQQELLLQATFTGPPVNVAAPILAGEAVVGSTLAATTGTWEDATSFTYQWVRCFGAACAPISGATSASYTATEADLGAQLRVDVTAKAEGGATATASAISDGVKPGAIPSPTNTALPTISGEPRANETLTGSLGNWAGTPTSFQQQWLRCATAAGAGCTPIPGASGSSYHLVREDVGSTIRLRVLASSAAGTTTADSAPTGIVQREVIKARLAIAPSPSCTGIPTHFDGRASSTPNGPIVRYRFTYREFPLSAILAAGFSGNELEPFVEHYYPAKALADGAEGNVTTTFSWVGQNSNGQYLRYLIYAYLTVTDRAGDSATTSELLTFAQYFSTESRAQCPKHRFSHRAVIGPATRISVASRAIAAALECKSPIACAVRVQAFVAAKGAATKSTLLADTGVVEIGARKKRNVGAKLTPSGLKLLRRGRQVRALIKITSIDPLGHAIARSVGVTLRRS